MSESATSGANAPEFSVSELSSALKRAIEDRFGYVRVRGEISGYRGPHSSGHVYFSLKDANARLDAVIWKGVFARMRVKPEEGLEVVVTGKITTFPGKSAYQIIVESLEPAGVGALMALLEARRRKLAEEGLFDPARKQLLPYLPRVIGVVTSPTGAVIRDILHRLSDRFPVHVLVSLRRGRSRRRSAASTPSRRTARFPGPTFSSSRAAAARSRTSGASTRKSSCAQRRKAKSR
jgi:exodeoxyribonuclease VII large subunit